MFLILLCRVLDWIIDHSSRFLNHLCISAPSRSIFSNESRRLDFNGTAVQKSPITLSVTQLDSPRPLEQPDLPGGRRLGGRSSSWPCRSHILARSRPSVLWLGSRESFRPLSRCAPGAAVEACSAFTHVTARTVTLPPYFVTCLSKGFRHFVTSMPAPAASGRSCGRVGLSSLESAPLSRRTPRSGHIGQPLP